MSQRAYCEQPHPGGDADADRWCEMYHAVAVLQIEVDDED